MLYIGRVKDAFPWSVMGDNGRFIEFFIYYTIYREGASISMFLYILDAKGMSFDGYYI